MPFSRPLRVFLCHASQDKPVVQELYAALKNEGWIDPWLDKNKILPGQNWEIAVEKAVANSDVIIVCLSSHSVSKEGYVQKEMRYAYDLALEKPEDTIFLIPVRLDNCDVPQKLKTFHWVDFFGGEKRETYQNLLNALKVRHAQKIKSEATNASNFAQNKNTFIEDNRRNKVSNLRKTPSVKKMPVYALLIAFSIIALSLLVFGGKYVFENTSPLLPPALTNTSYSFEISNPTSTQTATATKFIPTATATQFTPTMPPVTETPGIGATLISSETIMLYVPAGNFLMGSEQEDDEQPIHSVYLDGYYIDKYEVTNAGYRSCVQAKVCLPPGEITSQTRLNYYEASEYDEYPVVFVTWNMAAAYCQWRGARLPTEAEWEKSARGIDGRTYPWGNEFKCQNGNFDDETDWDRFVVPGGKNCDGYADTAPVGSFTDGRSPYNVMDMSGNVWEWVNDWYDEKYYLAAPVVNPAGPDSGTLKVVKGGGWDNYASRIDSIRSSFRIGLDPTFMKNRFGFRCALTP